MEAQIKRALRDQSQVYPAKHPAFHNGHEIYLDHLLSMTQRQQPSPAVAPRQLLFSSALPLNMELHLINDEYHRANRQFQVMAWFCTTSHLQEIES